MAQCRRWVVKKVQGLIFSCWCSHVGVLMLVFSCWCSHVGVSCWCMFLPEAAGLEGTI
jgi:hypothetical protein